VLGGTLDYPPGKDSWFVLARTINDFMPRHMFTLTMSGFARVNKPMQGAKIALLSWAFIANSDDARNTPSEFFRTLCMDKGSTVTVHDPYVVTPSDVNISSNHDETLMGADAVVIFTAHRIYRSLDPGTGKALTGRTPR